VIDWFTGLIGYDASRLKPGKVLILNPGGEITLSFDRWVDAFGSYDDRIKIKPELPTLDMVRSGFFSSLDKMPGLVFKLSGDPVKYLQGHNVFGPSVVSTIPVLEEVISRLPYPLRLEEVFNDSPVPIHPMRVDVTTSIRMDSHAMVHEFIQHAQHEMRSRHRLQGGLTKPSTVSFGITSTRWKLIIYCKFCELLNHPAKDPVMQAALLDYADGLLRIEVRLLRKELKDRVCLDESIIWDFYDRIEVGVMKDNADKEALNLRPPVRLIYNHWLDGHDVSPVSGYLKRAAFYKYRKEILEATGQDISLPLVKRKNGVSRDVFGSDYLKAHEVIEVPAHLQKYLFRPGDVLVDLP